MATGPVPVLIDHTDGYRWAMPGVECLDGVGGDGEADLVAAAFEDGVEGGAVVQAPIASESLRQCHAVAGGWAHAGRVRTRDPIVPPEPHRLILLG